MNTITTTLGALAGARPVLEQLARLRMDAKSRYHVAKLLQLTVHDVEHFHAEHDRLVQELGRARDATPDELARGARKTINEILRSSDRWPEFEQRLEELAALPATIAWGPLTSAMLDSCAEATAAQLLALGPLFVLDEPTEV